MIFPKKLLPSTEKEILKEISEELNIPLNKVNKTFTIWLDYLEDIVKNTDQSVVNFPRFGKMFLSYKKLAENKDLQWEAKKRLKIEKDTFGRKNDHKVTIPVHIIYGVSRFNYRIGKNYKKGYDLFTLDECVRRQNLSFFKEDKDFQNRKDVFEEYFNDIEKQEPLSEKDYYDYKSKIKRQGKIKWTRMVRRKARYMRTMSKKLNSK